MPPLLQGEQVRQAHEPDAMLMENGQDLLQHAQRVVPGVADGQCMTLLACPRDEFVELPAHVILAALIIEKDIPAEEG